MRSIGLSLVAINIQINTLLLVNSTKYVKHLDYKCIQWYNIDNSKI